MTRKLTTGRFETREELESEVWDRYHNTAQNMAQIARFARVSETTIRNILDKKGKEPMFEKDTVIFDLDGTLALIDHRRHLVQLCDGSPVTVDGQPGIFRGDNERIPGDVWIEFAGTGKWSYSPSNVKFKPNWPAFFAACVDDEPNEPVIATLHAHMARGHNVMIVSGRSDEVREQTHAWLFQHVFKRAPIAFAPIMRKAGDYTPDDQLKRQWLADGTIPHERVLCAYDDRDKVVQMWRNAGIACFQVAPGDF